MKAYTLFEVIITIIIVGALAMIFMSFYANYIKQLMNL
ncbi:MAG: prepilin-type N-terminal cleavage/methylation domain-containing protein [Endomicrobiaceae bacterium]|jgi:prepilin-type N-terminal cleavage/methylation domain-containing protein|nr:prepilin-type N-terminal cleavage/methylation domain-containing protein [Endomicrobiaceae bacterium]